MLLGLLCLAFLVWPKERYTAFKMLSSLSSANSTYFICCLCPTYAKVCCPYPLFCSFCFSLLLYLSTFLFGPHFSLVFYWNDVSHFQVAKDRMAPSMGLGGHTLIKELQSYGTFLTIEILRDRPVIAAPKNAFSLMMAASSAPKYSKEMTVSSSRETMYNRATMYNRLIHKMREEKARFANASLSAGTNMVSIVCEC